MKPIYFLISSMVMTVACAGPNTNVEFRSEEEGRIEVHVRGEHFTTYHYGGDSGYDRTPYLWPVKGEGGIGLTRNYPMAGDEIDDTDHPHHRSLFFVFGDVNGYDHWHNEPIVVNEVETGTGDSYAWIRSHNDWLDAEGEPILREVQELHFHDQPASGRLIGLETTFEAIYGEVTFGDDKEGMMSLRIRPEINGNHNGVLTNARGEQGEEAVYGTPSQWVDYSGSLEGYGQRGIAIFDHPDNFRQGYWHARDYGLLSLNPFARQEVGGLEEDGSYKLAVGETLTLRYAWFIHSGDVEEAEVAGHYKRFTEEGHTRVP